MLLSKAPFTWEPGMKLLVYRVDFSMLFLVSAVIQVGESLSGFSVPSWASKPPDSAVGRMLNRQESVAAHEDRKRCASVDTIFRPFPCSISSGHLVSHSVEREGYELRLHFLSERGRGKRRSSEMSHVRTRCAS